MNKISKHIIENISIICTRNHGYHVIRIDYTQINEVEYHIKEAISKKENIYLNKQSMYE